MILQKMKWPEVKDEIEKKAIAILPIGATEEHGPHLPIDTDIAIPYYVAVKAAEVTDDIVLPPINYGYNEKDLMFPGTLSAKPESFIAYVFDVCDSASRSGFKKILLYNGHGYNEFLVHTVGNMVNERTKCMCASTSYWRLIEDVVSRLRDSKFPGGMAHSGEFETSIQLFLDPENTEKDKAVDEISFKRTKYTWIDISKDPPVYIRTNFDKYTKSGVIGNAKLATKQKGEVFINKAIERLSEFLRWFRTDIEL